MSWRFHASPLLQLISSTGVGFIVGALTFFLVSHLYNEGSIPEAHVQPFDRRYFRVLPVDLINFRNNCSEGIAGRDVKSFLLDSFFDGISPYEGFPSNETSFLIKRKRLKGWGAEAAVFQRLINEVRPKVILELGSFLGASAIHMGTIVQREGLDSVILCVDDFRGWPGFRLKRFKDIQQQNGNNMLLPQFMRNVQFNNLTDIILPIPFSTMAAVTFFCDQGLRPDLIEVDAAHDFHSAWLDINSAYTMLAPGGVMFGHDYFNRANNKGVRRAVNIFASMKGLTVEPDGQHWILRNG